MSDKRLDRGIFQTPHGFRIILRINGTLDTKRFPPTWTLDALRTWRNEHEKIHRRKKGTRGMFDADALRYLNAVRAMPSFRDRERDIEWWIDIIGERPRWSITSEEIRTGLNNLRAAGVAASTCNHKRAALSHLYTVLDGKDAPNPVRDVPPFEEPPAIRRGHPLMTALRLIRRIQGYTRTRCLILLWTGMRPAELGRVEPPDLELDNGVVWTRTAKGGPARCVVLNRSALKAFRRFVRLEMWGAFSASSMRQSMQRAAKEAPAIAWQRGAVDLRHTFGTAMRKHADLADVQEQLGHSTPRMTKRYSPTEMVKIRAAVEAMRRDAVGRKLPARVTSAHRAPVSA